MKNYIAKATGGALLSCAIRVLMLRLDNCEIFRKVMKEVLKPFVVLVNL